ncbi:MAG: metalloregulator ArsR/SmtB family transcription factor [bacterium]|nr:metalloregulator ArsR/SmtB family transcription factor [bacterium]
MKGNCSKDMMEEMVLHEWSEKLKSLAHPVRLRIVEGLLRDECNVKKIQAGLGLPQSTVSQHLAILRKEKILRAEQKGTQKCYKVVDPKIVELVKLISK